MFSVQTISDGKLKDASLNFLFNKFFVLVLGEIKFIFNIERKQMLPVVQSEVYGWLGEGLLDVQSVLLGLPVEATGWLICKPLLLLAC